MHLTTRSSLAIGIALALTSAACGGSGDGSGDGATSTGTDPSSSENSSPGTDSSGTEPATITTDAAPDDTAAPVATDAPAVAATTTTATTLPLPQPEVFDLTTIPDLVAEIDAAVGDPSSDPLQIAQGLYGFPFDIGVPAGSSLFNATAGLNFVTDEIHPYNFTYRAVGEGGVVPDVDINLDDSGPGSVALIDFFDPVLANLGYERANNTGSDPGDPGGPHSINHVYVAEQETRDFNGVAGTVQPIFIWAEEDTNGWAYDEELPELGGWYVDIEGEFPADAEATPIPVVNALIEQMALPDGLTLSDVTVSLRNRNADAFSIDLGATYTDVYIEWEASADLFDSIVEHFADVDSVFPDPTMLMAGEDDFFNEGTILASELEDFGDTTKRLDVLLLQRYGGLLDIDASDDGTEPMTVSLDLELNPVAPELTLPTE